MIRPGRFDDIRRLLELGEMLHAESCFADQPFDRLKVADHLASLVVGANGGVLFVAERDGEVIGGMAGAFTEQWFNRERVVFDYSLFIEPAKRHGITAVRLIRALVEWAKIKGASHISIGITTGIHVESTARLYQSQGFEPAGVLFKMEVHDGC